MSAQTPAPIPGHLPKKLSICCWIWSWITSARADEPYGDLERCMVELKARGFNALRADVGLNWCFRPDGTPRGPMEFGPWIAGYSSNFRTVNAKGGARHDVLQRVLRLMELARQHDVFVIPTSWEYQDSTWFVADPAIRAEVYGIPEGERLRHMARQHDRLLRMLKDRGLSRWIAFVEVHNEVEYSEFPQGAEGKRLHTESIAFLRERHPEILITGDFASHDPAIVPDNAQVYDDHVYAGAALYFDGLYDRTVRHPQFNPQDPRALPAFRQLAKPDLIPWDVFMKPAGNIREWWRPIMYLYANLDNAKFDRWMHDRLAELEPQIKATAEEIMGRDAREAARRGIPAVVDEGGFFYPPLGSRFEESGEGLRFFDFMADLAVRLGYWGFMPTTYCGPEQPLWTVNPGWLKEVNTRFQEGRLA